MSYITHPGSLLLLCIYLITGALQAQSAREIIQKADAKVRGTSAYAEMSIQVVRPKWTKTMHLKTWTKGKDKSVSLVTAPAKEKGTVFLMRGKEIWNYIPSIERTIKLPPSMMMQNWMGTDMTNDDLIKQSSIVTDYEQEIVGSEMVEGRNCWKIALTPKPEASVVWGKILIWIDRKDYMQLKILYYDEDDFLVNKIIASDIKTFDRRVLPSKLEFIPVDKEGQKTIIRYQVWKFDVNIPEKYFSTRYMKRLK